MFFIKEMWLKFEKKIKKSKIFCWYYILITYIAFSLGEKKKIPFLLFVMQIITSQGKAELFKPIIEENFGLQSSWNLAFQNFSLDLKLLLLTHSNSEAS